MIRWWAFWRRVQYTTGLLVILSCIGVLVYYTQWYSTPTCTDGIQNAEERGVDCGGVCAKVCIADVTPLEILWVKSFQVVDGQYNAVAYIENRNRSIGSPEVMYSMKLFDNEGLIIERRGSTVIPPDGVYPIFEGRIQTGERIPTKTTIEFDSNVTWLPTTAGREQFTLERRDLRDADGTPRLNAALRNNAQGEAKDVEIIATIFDKKGNPLTAARTVVEYFRGRTTENVIFTWPEPIAKTLRSCEVPTDVVLAIDLSGSMNNDGGTPPEPLTSVLTAAGTFVERLNERDQAGVVTYATGAMLVQPLSTKHTDTKMLIEGLAISPKEEQGSTNTGEALLRMGEEFDSVRHNKSARKVAVLLTDGLATAPDPDPEAYASEEATKLKAQDVQLFTVGLGEKANEVFLTELATDRDYYFKAPSIRELDSIYRSITESICEDGVAVIEIIAKPKMNFGTGGQTSLDK